MGLVVSGQAPMGTKATYSCAWRSACDFFFSIFLVSQLVLDLLFSNSVLAPARVRLRGGVLVVWMIKPAATAFRQAFLQAHTAAAESSEAPIFSDFSGITCGAWLMNCRDGVP